ncbi:MAG: DUF1987 domain-containing protein [Bacteroidales bacterium]|nr:DUF1987 domain-containing protein [Bacteroidales bacterium]
MRKLYKEPTNTTPKIDFNNESGNLSISGCSLPEDSDDFFTPIFDWLQDYIQTPNTDTKFEFNFDYYNSSTLRKVVEIILILKKIQSPNTVKIMWYYDEGDETSQENGEDIQSVIGIPMELIEKKYE